jgi:uncharacterized Ntn-hydrolase superfamily protein
MTYSIVGCDLEAREWGIAVQSKFLGVGALVPFAAAEVGAVATQAHANVAYGPDGLALLQQGRSASEVAAAQGNILASVGTVEALAATFQATEGKRLAERLLACLQAAQIAGGDRRGMQSASLTIVREAGGYGGRNDRLIDLRIDDDASPIAELERVFRIHDMLFGETPRERWIKVDTAVHGEIEQRLRALGYAQEPVLDAFDAWAGTENLEERVDGLAQVDPVVLAALRGEIA